MSRIKVVWTRFGVIPGKIAGGTGTKYETTRRLSDRCDFYIMTHEAIYNWYREFGIQVKPVCLINGQVGKFGSIVFLVYCMLKCIFTRVDEHFDIVAARNHDLWDLLPALWIKFQTKAKLIVYIQARVLPEWGGRSLVIWFIVFTERLLGLTLTRLFADQIIIRNSGDIRILRKFGIRQCKISVVGHGINTDDIERVATPKERTYDCLFFGRIAKEKGTFDLLEAWRIVRERYPEAKLLILGPSTEAGLKRIDKIITRYSMEKNVTVLNTILGTEKFEQVKQSKVFALPSYVDTFSYSVGEALACRVPVVVYDIPSLRAVWEDSITYCRKGDINELAQRILELLGDEELAQSRAERGHQFVQRYTWDKAIAEEYAVMQHVLLGEE